MRKNYLSVENVSELFALNKEKNKMQKREGVKLEFKEAFNFGNMAMYFRTMASFANRNGGYIIFGVKDKPREPIGMNSKNLEMFENLKIEELTNNLNEYFSPEILWEHCIYEFNNKYFGIMYIHELENKPAICKKNYDGKEEKYSLKDGDIYYRYSGRSQRIRYSELVEIIDEKRKKEERMWLDYLIKSSRIGVENIGLLDLKRGNMQSKEIKSIYIDEELLKQIKFIKEGAFNEVKGSPSLKLMGEIENINGEKIILKEGKEKIKIRGISEVDIIETFLRDKEVSEEAEEYIKEITNCKTAFVPVYYYLFIGGISLEDGVEIIENVNVRTNAKTKIIERLKNNRREKSKMPQSKQAEIFTILKEIEEETIELDDNKVELFLKTVISIDDSVVARKILFIKKILLDIFKKYYSSEDRTLVGKIRKAICRIDETMYEYNINNLEK